MVASLASLVTRAWSSMRRGAADGVLPESHTPSRRKQKAWAPSEMLMQLEPRRVMSVVPDNHTIIKMNTTYGEVFFELFDDAAPITVANFLSYVSHARLDGTFFHRMVHKADQGIDILQGGGYTLQSQITTDPAIVLEHTGKSNLKGTLAMARTSELNSATSQFFINVTDNTTLDTAGGGYAVFGQIIKGQDVVDQIFTLPTANISPFPNIPVTPAYHGGSPGTQDLVFLNTATVVDRASFRAVAGSQIAGAVNSSDSLFITSLGLDGRAEVFTPDATDQWLYKNLRAATGSPAITGNLAAFYDAKTGLRYATGPSASGLILFTQGVNGTWTYSNLTTTVSGGQIIQSEVTVFTTTDGFVYIAGMSDAGDLVAFRQTGTSSNWSWQFHNFSDVDLATRGLTTPAFTGRLTSYVTAWNGLNIVGLDGNGDIQAVWWAPGIDQDLWTSTNLSDVTGAPAFTGGLTVYITSWYATNIIGITQDGHVSATWWLPEFEGNWRTDDLTAQYNGALLVGTTISSFITPWGAMNIGGLDQTGKLWVYWWAPASGAGNWTVTDMSTAVPAGTKPMVGRITGVTSPANTINLVGTAANGDVMRYYWSPSGDGSWKADDVSYLSSIT